MKKISVITGGHGGMGKAIAKELGKDSALVLAARSKKKLLAAQAELQELGYEVYTFTVDISNEARVKELAEYVHDMYKAFMDAGFSEDQAWQLAGASYQSALGNN